MVITNGVTRVLFGWPVLDAINQALIVTIDMNGLGMNEQSVIVQAVMQQETKDSIRAIAMM